jgi:hypothetical protein
VTPSDDLFPPRRPIFFPVVIATVFLTIIAGTVGSMLGERDRSDNRGAGSSETAPTQGVADTSASSAPSGPLCPEEAIQTAESLQLRSDLRQIFKVVTAKGTTVWICQDGAGSLYFQSKTGGVDAELVQGKNGLFLDNVTRIDEDDYKATAARDLNTFEVNRERLVVHFASGKRDDDIQPVVSVE